MPIDLIPYPAYDDFGVMEYHKRNGITHVGVLTARGCPFHCTFCAHTCRYRTRSIPSVLDEIDYYQNKYAPDLIVFNDNTLNVMKSRFMRVCEGMQGRGILWTAAIRCDVWDAEMACAAKMSGCRYLVVGVESFDQSKLNRVEKHLTVSDIHRTLNLLHHYDIDYHGNLIVGVEGDTIESIESEIASLNGYKVIPALLQVFPGNRSKRADLPKAYLQDLEMRCKAYAEDRGKHVY
jgi:anaerobic magnesium-protoporphyrin IX monomethyl ester cyclase